MLLLQLNFSPLMIPSLVSHPDFSTQLRGRGGGGGGDVAIFSILFVIPHFLLSSGMMIQRKEGNNKSLYFCLKHTKQQEVFSQRNTCECASLGPSLHVVCSVSVSSREHLEKCTRRLATCKDRKRA